MGTLLVNLGGCFLMAFVMYIALNVPSLSLTVRMMLTTGFLGGFTTYSSFNYETTKLLQQGAFAQASMYFGCTTIGCFLAGLLGLILGRLVVGS